MGVKYGGTIEYTINYSNLGSLPLTGVTISDLIPSGTNYVAGSASAGGSFSGGGDNGRGIVNWNIGNLGAGQTGSVSFSVVVDDPTDPLELTVINSAQISGERDKQR